MSSTATLEDRMAIPTIEANLDVERARLVRLCARLTGDRDAAEDLAQETLLEAWRNRRKLLDNDGLTWWLSSIARNVCLRWARSRGQQLAQQVALRCDPDTPDDAAAEASFIDDFDLEVELERKELIELLDRALTLLPPEVRMILIKRYVNDSSLNELATDLGINTSAATMRLQRGKLALRQVLTTNLRQEIAPYIMNPLEETWTTTSIWCPLCGHHRLLGKYDAKHRELVLQCSQNSITTCNCFSLNTPTKHVLGDIKAFKPALTKLLNWSSTYIERHNREHSVPCVCCGQPLSLSKGIPELDGWQIDSHGFYGTCTQCNSHCWLPLPAFVLTLPEGRRFWQEHPRIHLLPEQQIELDGQAALLTRFESVTNQQSLVVVAAADTLAILRIM